jgi:hypothetical protein
MPLRKADIVRLFVEDKSPHTPQPVSSGQKPADRMKLHTITSFSGFWQLYEETIRSMQGLAQIFRKYYNISILEHWQTTRQNTVHG